MLIATLDQEARISPDMAEFPALPLFTDAYLGDTTHLTTFEHGAYLLLLILSWRAKECRLPDDDILLARYTKTTQDKWRKLRPILQPFFTVENGFWRQARLRDEFQHLQSRKAQQIEAGNASAQAKALKRNNRNATPVDPTLQRNGNERATPTPTPTPTPTLKEEGAKAPLAKSFADEWNAMANRTGLPTIRSMTKSRKAALGARIAEHGSDAITEAIAAVERSPWCCGDNDRGWKADFDFILQPKSFNRLIEGSYERTESGKPKQQWQIDRDDPRGLTCAAFDDAFSSLGVGRFRGDEIGAGQRPATHNPNRPALGAPEGDGFDGGRVPRITGTGAELDGSEWHGKN